MKMLVRRVFPLLVLALLTWPVSPTSAAPAPAPAAEDVSGFTHYAETQHNVSFAIKRFYDAHGGPDVFGFPLTEAFKDSNGTTTQFFEKAQIVLNSDVPGGVQLMPLGRAFSQGRQDAPFQPMV